MPEFEIELTQKLYWLVNYESTAEDIEDAIEEIETIYETEEFQELNDHHSFAAHEEREMKILSINGETWSP